MVCLHNFDQKCIVPSLIQPHFSIILRMADPFCDWSQWTLSMSFTVFHGHWSNHTIAPFISTKTTLKDMDKWATIKHETSLRAYHNHNKQSTTKPCACVVGFDGLPCRAKHMGRGIP